MGMGTAGVGQNVLGVMDTARSDPNYVNPKLALGPDDRPIGSQPMGLGTAKFDSTNTTTTADIMGGDKRSNPQDFMSAINTMKSILGTENGGASTQQTAQQQPTTVNPNPNTGAGSFAGPNTYSAAGSGSGFGGGFGGGSGGAFPLEGKYGIVKMANGGLAGAAQNMADKGRNGDSMLVHMTPGEVKGLQQLAMANGGSLSINPDTGLVEANILKRFLPMIAGAALSPFLTPMGAAAVVGGFEGMRTGDIGKGLMAGLGAYGGAGLTSGISQAGTASIADAGGSAAVNSLGSQATNLSADQLTNLSAEQLAGLQDVAKSGAYNTADVLKTANMANTSAGAQNFIGASNLPNLNATQLQAYNDTLASGAYNPADVVRTAGAQNATAGASGMQTFNAGVNAGPTAIYDAMPGGTMMGLGSTAVSALTPEMDTSVPGVPGLDEKYKRPPYSYELSSDFTGYTPRQPKPYYRPRGLGYAAQGGSTGDIMMRAGGSYDDEPGMDMAAGGITGYAGGGKPEMKKMSLGDGMYRDTDSDTASLGAYDAAMKRMEKQFGAANLKPTAMPKSRVSKLGEIKTGIAAAAGGGSIGGYSDGGRMLKGPGDGMSDSIPATIGRKQPARLADGEFVVPADVVSHLGNGSTDAGARKLYSMMDKVRTARTGKKKQAPAVKTDKYLPK